MKKEYFQKKTNKVLLFIGIICAFLCISLHGFAQEEDEESEGPELTREAQVALVAAQELMEQEDYTNARTPVLEYLATQPEFIPEIAYMMLGHLWYMDETLEDELRLGESLKVFKAGHEAFPESEGMLQNYAGISYEAGNYVDAGRLFERLYNISEEKEIGILLNAAGSYYAGENLNESKRVFKLMIDLPGKAETDWYDTIISICLEQENLDEAEDYILEALNEYPMNESYWRFLADMRMNTEDYRGAASALEIGFNIEPPDDRSGWSVLLDLYTYLNVPLRVAKSLEEVFEKSAAEEADHIRIAQAYAKSHRIDKATAYLDKINSQNPSINIILQKGKILFDARRNQEAIEVFDECIALDSKLYEAYIYKGFAAWDLEDWDMAEDAFEQARSSKVYGAQARDALVIMDDLKKAQEE